MNTLSYGYKLPQNPDTGDIVFPALEADIQQLNDHTHDGINSAPLARDSVSVASGSWVAAPVGGGVYRQLITLPGSTLYDSVDIWFRVSTGEFVYPTVEKVSAQTFYVYTNDNSLTYLAYFR